VIKTIDKKSCLIILVKNMVRGRVKRRLAQSIGSENAMLLYQHLMKKICDEVRDFPVYKFVYYSDFLETDELWDQQFFEKKVQVKGNLGVRMQKAFDECFEAGFERVILIGSDIINLNKKTLKEAFDQLQEADVVLGPAFDGGYYLIGMNQKYNFLFQDKPWGTSSVFIRTLRDCIENDLICKLTPELSDLDRISDLKYLEPEDKIKFAYLMRYINSVKK
jgi:rSAM/selenodomain-associated transferase 1